MCTRYPIINRVSELKVHIELTRFVQPEKIEIDANERAVNEKSQYCFFVCTTFDSFLNDLSICIINQNLFATTATISFAMRDSCWTFTQFQIVRFFYTKKTFVGLSTAKVMSRELIRYPLIISSPQYGHFMKIHLL